MALTLLTAVSIFAKFLYFVIFARAISTWLPIGRENGIVKILYILSEPIIAPIRGLMRKSPLGNSGLDFSPIIALFAIELVQTILSSIIIKFL